MRRAAITGPLAGLLLAGLAAGCQGTPRPGPGADARPARADDKARLYGDPGLVPTREGERIRLEVALAGEIETSLTALPGVDRARVTLTLPTGKVEPARASVVVVGPRASSRRGEVERIARAAAPALDEGTVDVVTVDETANGPEPRGRSLPDLPLTLALLGLGASLGVSLDRFARRMPRGRGSRRARRRHP